MSVAQRRKGIWDFNSAGVIEMSGGTKNRFLCNFIRIMSANKLCYWCQLASGIHGDSKLQKKLYLLCVYVNYCLFNGICLPNYPFIIRDKLVLLIRLLKFTQKCRQFLGASETVVFLTNSECLWRPVICVMDVNVKFITKPRDASIKFFSAGTIF